MSFRYVNKIRLGDDFQMRKQNSTWRCLSDTSTKFDLEMSFRYVNKIGICDDVYIRKQNSDWRCLLDT